MKETPRKTSPVYAIEVDGQKFKVLADAKPLKTPVGKDFILPTQKLADAVIDEWRAQKDKINPATMPLTQLAATAIDIASKDRGHIVDQLTAYVGSELLCHQADHPEALKQLQHNTWQPLLDWCALRFDALLQTGSGIMPIKQTPEAKQALKRTIESYDDFRLVGLRHAVDVSGSLILGLALAEKHLSPEQIVKAAELDADFQMQQWGEDPAIVQKQKDMLKELELCQKWFELLLVVI